MAWQLVLIALAACLWATPADAAAVPSHAQHRIVVHCVYDTDPPSVADNAAILDEAIRMLADAAGSNIVIVTQEDVGTDVAGTFCHDDPARAYLLHRGVPPNRISVELRREEPPL